MLLPNAEWLERATRSPTSFDKEYIKRIAIEIGRNPFETISYLDYMILLVNTAVRANDGTLAILLRILRESQFHLHVSKGLWRCGKYLSNPRASQGAMFAPKAINLLVILATEDVQVREELISHDKLNENIINQNKRLAKKYREVALSCVNLFYLYITDSQFHPANTWRDYIDNVKFAFLIQQVTDICNIYREDEEITMRLLAGINIAAQNGNHFDVYNNQFYIVIVEHWKYLFETRFKTMVDPYALPSSMTDHLEFSVRTTKRRRKNDNGILLVDDDDNFDIPSYKTIIDPLMRAYDMYFIEKSLKQED